MQKLYLTAHAQCHGRGAGQNVKPQKSDPLWSSKNTCVHPFQLKHLDRQVLEEEETLYIKNSMEEEEEEEEEQEEEEEDKTLLREKRGLVKYPPAPPDR